MRLNRHKKAWFWVLLLWCGACQAPSEAPQAPPEPPADRETWDGRLEIQGPAGFRAEIRNAYEQYFSAGQITQGDSGVQVLFYNSAATAYSRLEAERMQLNHKTQELALAGQVRILVGDSLQVYADSLRGSLRDEHWTVLGKVRLQGSRGYQEGSDLEATFDFGQWSMNQVKAQLEVGPLAQPKTLVLAARQAQSLRAGEQLASYKGVEVEYDGAQIMAGQAVYDDTGQVLHFSGGVVSVDSLRRLEANRLVFQLETDVVLADSNIVLEEDGWRLQAERAERQASSQRWHAWGAPARMRRQDQYLSALTLVYDRDADAVEAEGNATFKDAERRLVAGGLRYRLAADTLEAYKGVVLHIDEVQGAASADELLYDVGAQRAMLVGAPQCQILSFGDTLTLKAGRLEVDLKSDKLQGQGDFKATHRRYAAQAGHGVYDYANESLELHGGALLKSLLEDGYHQLQADSLRLDLAEGALVKIEAPVAVQGTLEKYGHSIAWIEAGAAQAFFNAGTLERIELTGNADMTQSQLGGEQKVHRFLGDKMVLHFGQVGQLKRLKISGTAQMWSRLPAKDEAQGTAINYMEGDSLEVLLEDGRLDQVQGGTSSGRYYPPRSTELK